jgi:HlyD family secretion protein
LGITGRRLAIWGVLAAVLAAGLVFALWPKPVAVDLAKAEKSRLLVTIDDDGETRVREAYTLYAPLGGYLRRIEAEAGDPVAASKTVLADIEPPPPAFLDVRTEAEQRQTVEAAQAAQQLAEAEVESAKADLAFADSELERAKRLFKQRNVAERTLDDARRGQRVAKAKLATAVAALHMRAHELEQARSRLLTRREMAKRGGDCECVRVTAPVDGKVLRVIRKSAGIVEAGAPLMEIGDPRDLEIVVDLLSEDAVKVASGARAIITGWGGPALNAMVRRVEPFGRTEVSALGIEEQRVDVVLDLADLPAKWNRLGHGFRVDVGIVLFDETVLTLPLGALFRHGGGWAVFKVVDGRAKLQPVEIGMRNDLTAGISGGLEAGDRVVLYPGETIADGTAIAER